MIKSQKGFSSSSIYGSVIDLPSSLPPPSSTLHAAFFPDLLQSDGFTAASPWHHHILTVALMLPSLLLPRQSILSWKKQGLFVVLLLNEPLLSTWSRRNMKAVWWLLPAQYHHGYWTLPPSKHHQLHFTFQWFYYLSQLDLQKEYYKVPVKQEVIEKTAFITPFGMLEFLVMLFSLRNASITALCTWTTSLSLASTLPLMSSTSGKFFFCE